MRSFYTKAISLFAILLVTSAGAAYFCIEQAFPKVHLLPSPASPFPWKSALRKDEESSSISIEDDFHSLSFGFKISTTLKDPYASVEMIFDEMGERLNSFIDLSKFNRISFSAKCSEPDVLYFAVFAFDEKFSALGNYLTYRAPSSYFSCGTNWSKIDIDLTRLETPQWWYGLHNLSLSNNGYRLDQVSRFAFGNSPESPKGVDTRVQIDEITLYGEIWTPIYLGLAALMVVWSGFLFWLFKAYTLALTEELKQKLQKDRPLVAYQQLSLEAHRDKDKSNILRYLSTGYANAELSLESLAAATGVSRTKINEILKAEMGYTFTGYLNKLRLTEAARLLQAKDDANIAEIAYSVGYKNVPYFNKLFKEEYSCTPKTFKSLCEQSPTSTSDSP